MGSSNLTFGKLSSSKLNSKNAVFIGIIEKGHAYIVAVENRFDGHYFDWKSSLKKTDRLHRGIVIRLEDSDGTFKNKVENFIQKGNVPSTTCVSGVCTVMNKSQAVSINGKKYTIFIPLIFSKKL